MFFDPLEMSNYLAAANTLQEYTHPVHLLLD